MDIQQKLLTGSFITSSSNVSNLFHPRQKSFQPWFVVTLVRNNDSPKIGQGDLFFRVKMRLFFSGLRSICPGESGQSCLYALKKTKSRISIKKLSVHPKTLSRKIWKNLTITKLFVLVQMQQGVGDKLFLLQTYKIWRTKSQDHMIKGLCDLKTGGFSQQFTTLWWQ